MVDSEKTGIRFRNRDRGIACTLFVIFLILVPAFNFVSAHFAYEEWYLLDEGSIAYAASRVSFGEFPHIDYQYYYAGGFELILGVIFKVFGTSFGVGRWALGFCMALTTATTYLLHRKLGISVGLSILSTLFAISIGYGLNFHFYPAWLATLGILLSILFILKWLETERSRYLLLVGLVIGVTLSLKQNVGVFIVLACMMFVPLSATFGHIRKLLAEIHAGPTVRMLGTRYLIAAISPVVAFVFLTYLIRSRLDYLNVGMFLLIPALIVGLSAIASWQCWQVGTTNRISFVRLFERSALLVGIGTLLGVLPIVSFYLWHGGFTEFVNESFLTTQGIFAKRYSVFKFLEGDSQTNVFVFARRLGIYLIPHIAMILGFGFAIHGLRKDRIKIPAKLLLYVSLILAVMFFSFYPIANRVYLLYILPIVVLPVTYAVEIYLSSKILRPLHRVLTMVGVLVCVVGAYFGVRVFAGDLSGMAIANVELINEAKGNILVPSTIANHIRSPLKYLEGRPRDESFVAFDVYNKPLAFLTGRAVSVDYQQRHYYRELTPADVQELQAIASAGSIKTIILGRGHLVGTNMREDFLKVFDQYYVLKEADSLYLVFQRTDNN